MLQNPQPLLGKGVGPLAAKCVTRSWSWQVGCRSTCDRAERRLMPANRYQRAKAYIDFLKVRVRRDNGEVVQTAKMVVLWRQRFSRTDSLIGWQSHQVLLVLVLRLLAPSAG